MSDEFEEKIIAARKADPIPVPSDEEGYFKWLKSEKATGKHEALLHKARMKDC